MTEQRLAEIESMAIANDRAEQSAKMEQAMKAVEFVSKIKYPHPATYQLRQQRRKQIKARSASGRSQCSREQAVSNSTRALMYSQQPPAASQ